jgi:hypothetical protein
MLSDSSSEGDRILRWQLSQDWPVGNLGPIPATTILTGVGDGHGGIASPPSWRGNPLPVSNTVPMPIEVVSLDAEASAIMKSWYANYEGIDLRYRLQFGPGVT